MADVDNALHIPTRVDSIMMLSTYVPSLGSAWALVAVSGAFEIVFALLMKESDGFNKPTPSAIAVAAALVTNRPE